MAPFLPTSETHSLAEIISLLIRIDDQTTLRYPAIIEEIIKEGLAGHLDACLLLLTLDEIGLLALESNQADRLYQQIIRADTSAACHYAHARHLLLTKKDYLAAESKLLASAKQGFVPAQLSLGKMYLWQDEPEKAKVWLRQAAEQTNIQAAMLLVCHAINRHDPQQMDELKKWLHIAVEANHPIACQNMAIYILQGLYGPPDKERALSLLYTAAEQDPTAWISIALLLTDEETDDLFHQKTSLDYWHIAAEKGQSDAMIILADCYETGHGVEKNPEKAKTLRRQVEALNPQLFGNHNESTVEEKNQIVTQIYLGTLSEINIGPVFDKSPEAMIMSTDLFDKKTEKDIAQWVEHLLCQYPERRTPFNQSLADRQPKGKTPFTQRIEMAAEAGEVEAQLFYGQLLLEGKVYPQDTRQGILWLETSAQHHPFAQFFLAGLYRHGAYGIVPDPSLALSWLEKAANSPLWVAKYHWAKLQIERDADAAFSLFKAIAAEGTQEERDEERQWGYYYFDMNLPEAFERKKDFLEKNAAAGHDKAQFELALLYELMAETQPDLYPKIVDLYAAVSQHITAKFRLGLCYLNGLGIEKNEQKAFTLIKQAIEYSENIHNYEQERIPIVELPYTMALLHETGYGTPQNHQKALQWYHKASINYLLKIGQTQDDFWGNPACITQEKMPQQPA